jgi:hypothetical protein
MGRNGNTWAHTAAQDIAPWMDGKTLTSSAQWHNSIQLMKAELVEADFDRLRLEAQTHHNLKSYMPTWWLQTGCAGYNRTLLKCGLSQSAAKLVGRLIVGGQGIRGGDPEDENLVTPYSCCHFCLEQGLKTNDTLRHVTFVCPAYAESRMSIARIIHQNPNQLFIICRKYWSWAEIRQITKFFHEVVQRRAKPWGTADPRIVNTLIQDEVNTWWSE